MADFMKMAPTTSDALQKRHKHNISSNTLGTLDFLTLKPVYCRKLDPGDTIDMDISSYIKLNPMNKPVLGNFRVVTRAFFVPNYTTMAGYNEFTTQSPYHNSNGLDFVIKNLCYTTYSDLFRIFATQGDSYGYNRTLLKKLSGDFDHYDLSFYNMVSDEVEFYNFNQYGRKVYDVFISLGYKFIFPQSSEQWGEIDTFYTNKISVMPILAFIKVFYDWYANRQFDSAEALRSLFLKDPQSADGVHYTEIDLMKVLNCIFASYGSDYFTSQFVTPYGPNVADFRPGIELKDVSVPAGQQISGVAHSQSSYVRSGPNGTPVLDNSANIGAASNRVTNIYQLSQYILDGLKVATDYVTAHRIAGNKVIDQFLIQFGYKSQYDDMMLSQVIGHFDEHVNVGEVNATTENSSAGQVLGDFAGRGHAVGQGKHLHYECGPQSRGYLLIISYVEPQTSIVSGMHRELFDVTPLDEYNGRFDGRGPQATYYAELMGSQVQEDMMIYDMSKGRYPDNIFGYMPRYAHYKIGYDSLQGDFARMSMYEMMRQWHMFRDLDWSIREYDEFPELSYNFCLGNDEQFNHIFAVTDASIDNFIANFYFHVELWSNKLPLWESYDYAHDDEHKKLLMQINGQKVD